MMAFHQDGDVETYLLTIMNMVSALYLDPTIGNFINIVVVRIILIEEDDVEVRGSYLVSFIIATTVTTIAFSRFPSRADAAEIDSRGEPRFCPSKGWTSW